MRIALCYLTIFILVGPAMAIAKNQLVEVNRSLALYDEQSLVAQVEAKGGKVLVRQLVTEGFLLKNDGRLIKIFKPYKNKKLTADQVTSLTDKVRALYAEAGYEKLISFSYQLKKGRLIINASLIE